MTQRRMLQLVTAAMLVMNLWSLWISVQARDWMMAGVSVALVGLTGWVLFRKLLRW